MAFPPVTLPPAPRKHRTLLRLLQVALLALVGWGIYRALAPQLRQLTWQDLAATRPDALLLSVSFLMLLGVYVWHGLLWRRIMRDLGIGDRGARATLHIYFLSSLGRYIPGKLWQLAGLAVLAKRAGLPPGAATAAAVLGQFGFLTTGLLFLGLMLPEWRTVMAPDAPAGFGPVLLGAGLLVLAAVALWVLVATPAGHGAREAIVRRLGAGAGERLRAAFDLADRVRPRDAAVWGLSYALTWLLLGGAFLLFVAAFHPAAFDAPRFVAGTVAASYLAGYVFLLVPAGIGVREGVMLLLLQQVIPDAAAAVAVSIMSRVWFTAAELVPLGVLSILPGGDATGEEIA